ncbi:MAG: class II aldolase/adducin family protein [Bacteroidota bacterium]
MDEGYIKFKFELVDGNLPEELDISDVNDLRTKVFDLGLIGFYENISYGNISKRLDGLNFVITASNTGKYRVLSPEQFTVITFVDIDRNFVKCIGKYPPSSETITHFAIYSTFPNANFVVHFHNSKIWNELKNKKITTPDNVEYGTVELARSILNLKSIADISVEVGTIVLGGHKDGVIVFGSNVEQLLEEIYSFYKD